MSAESPTTPEPERTPLSAGQRLGLAALLLALPLLLLWPLPVSLRSHVLAAPDQEAATHIWGLWAALREGEPLLLRTTLLGWSQGVELVLVDPANLLAFAIGDALGGPAAGYNLVLYFGLVVQGLAGLMLARHLGGSPWLGAVAAMACPTLISNAADGQTEGFAVGWVGVQLALLLGFVSRGGAWRGLGAAGALAMAWYGGPYNGLFASALDAAVGLGLLARARGDRPALWTRARRLLSVGALGVLLVAPLAIAILTMRDPTLPGSQARAGLPRIVENPAIFRGGVQTGADLTDPFLPGPLTGGEADVSHTAYLGVVALSMALLAVRADRRRWPWLLGALGWTALSLGPHLYLGGEALRLGDRPLLGPAGVLTLGMPVLGRLTRWYRAGAVASLLLAPLVACAGGKGARAVAVASLLVLDALLLAPLAWPLHATPMLSSEPYAVLSGEGALFEIPRTTTGQPPPGEWRDRTALAQTLHGRPVAGTIMGLSGAPETEEHHQSVLRLLRSGSWRAADRARLLAAGYRWVALLPTQIQVPPESLDNLNACLGPPLYRGADYVVWTLEGDRQGEDCLPPTGLPSAR